MMTAHTGREELPSPLPLPMQLPRLETVWPICEKAWYPNRVWIGVELEYYLSTDPTLPPEATDTLTQQRMMRLMQQACLDHGISHASMATEDGPSQYEVKLWHQMNQPMGVVEAIHRVRAACYAMATSEGLYASFAPKPYPHLPGSGMHLHVSLETPNAEWLFASAPQTEHPHAPPPESPWLLHALGGLCASLPAATLCLIPSDAGYQRCQRSHNAPSVVSWGGNNRTVALRVPSFRGAACRIEHRVPSADADPDTALAAILAGMHHGIQEQITPPPRIYGNAYDAQYGLPLLPQSLSDAITAYEQCPILAAYVSAR